MDFSLPQVQCFSFRFPLLLSLLLTSPTVFPQVRPGRLTGFVLDAAAQPLEGVSLTLSSTKIGIKNLRAVTDERGVFHFEKLLPSDDYRLRVEFAGHSTVELEVEIREGRRTVETITLRPEQDLQEEVEVVGKGDAVKTDRPETMTTCQDDFIEGLPVIGREYRDVLVLAPGVVAVVLERG